MLAAVKGRVLAMLGYALCVAPFPASPPLTSAAAGGHAVGMVGTKGWPICSDRTKGWVSKEHREKVELKAQKYYTYLTLSK